MASATSRENVRRSICISGSLECARAHERLEPARPGRRPALDDNFLLREELHGIPALSVQIAEEAVARATEGEERHWRGHRNVHADVSDLGFVAESPRARTAGCEQARLIAVRPGVDERDRLIERVDVMNRQHRSED